MTARSVIIATGRQYNRLSLERLADLEGVGVDYAATQMEAQACAAKPVVIVGAGSAVSLSRTSTDVRIVIRGSLAHSMSHYLIERIEANPRIRVWPHTQVNGLPGERGLEGVVLRDNRRQTTSTLSICDLFVFIGATPNTAWLAEDQDGFLLTGAEFQGKELAVMVNAPHRAKLA